MSTILWEEIVRLADNTIYVGPTYHFLAHLLIGLKATTRFPLDTLKEAFWKYQEFDGQSSFFQGRIFCLELSAFFLTLLKDSIFAAGGKTVFIVEFINLQQAVKCGQRMRKIFGRCKNLPQKVSP